MEPGLWPRVVVPALRKPFPLPLQAEGVKGLGMGVPGR